MIESITQLNVINGNQLTFTHININSSFKQQQLELKFVLNLGILRVAQFNLKT